MIVRPVASFVKEESETKDILNTAYTASRNREGSCRVIELVRANLTTGASRVFPPRSLFPLLPLFSSLPFCFSPQTDTCVQMRDREKLCSRGLTLAVAPLVSPPSLRERRCARFFCSSVFLRWRVMRLCLSFVPYSSLVSLLQLMLPLLPAPSLASPWNSY